MVNKKYIVVICIMTTLIILTLLPFHASASPLGNILNVPYKKQGPCQCGPASLYMVLRFWGDSVEYNQIVDAIWHKDTCITYIGDMVYYAAQRGFHVIARSSSIEELKEYIDEGFPVIVLQKYSKSNPRGHFRVVIGYDDRGFIVHDPDLSPGIHIDYALFAELWKPGSTFETINWSMVVLPEGVWQQLSGQLYSKMDNIINFTSVAERVYGLSREEINPLVKRLVYATFKIKAALFVEAREILREVEVQLIGSLENRAWRWTNDEGLKVYANLTDNRVHCGKVKTICLTVTLNGELIQATGISVSVNGTPVATTALSPYIVCIDTRRLYEMGNLRGVMLQLRVLGAKTLNVNLSLIGVYKLVIIDPLRGINQTKIVLNSTELNLDFPSTPLQVDSKTRFVFEGWLVNGEISREGMVRVKGDTNVYYVWNRQFLVTVEPSPFVRGWVEWINEKSRLVLEAENSVVNLGNGTRLVFDGWQVDGKFYKDTRVEVEVTQPLTFSTGYHYEYYVDAESDYGEVTGNGWYCRSCTATIALSTARVEGLLWDTVFSHWESNGSVFSEKPSFEFNVSAPTTLRAVWRRDYSKLYLVMTLVIIGLVVLMALKRKALRRIG